MVIGIKKISTYTISNKINSNLIKNISASSEYYFVSAINKVFVLAFIRVILLSFVFIAVPAKTLVINYSH